MKYVTSDNYGSDNSKQQQQQQQRRRSGDDKIILLHQFCRDLKTFLFVCPVQPYVHSALDVFNVLLLFFYYAERQHKNHSSKE